MTGKRTSGIVQNTIMARLWAGIEQEKSSEFPLNPILVIGAIRVGVEYWGTLQPELLIPRGQGLSSLFEAKRLELDQAGFGVGSSRTLGENISYDIISLLLDARLRSEAVREALRNDGRDDVDLGQVEFKWDPTKGRWWVAIPGEKGQRDFLTIVGGLDKWREKLREARKHLVNGDRQIDPEKFQEMFDPALRILDLGFDGMGNPAENTVNLQLMKKPARDREIIHFLETEVTNAR